jgi:hypothetical protein
MGPLSVAACAVGAFAIGRVAIANAVIRRLSAAEVVPPTSTPTDRLGTSPRARSRNRALFFDPGEPSRGPELGVDRACLGKGLGI